MKAISAALLTLVACSRQSAPAPVPASFAEATAELERRTGSPAGPLTGTDDAGDDRPLPEGRSFVTTEATAQRILDDLHKPWRAAGLYVFRYDRSYGHGDGKDKIALLPSSDPLEVIAKIGTNGANYDLTNSQIVDWLRGLHEEAPFDVTEAGLDYIEGRFDRVPPDPDGLARRLYKFCPDIVDQGVGSVEKLADALREERILYLWWD